MVHICCMKVATSASCMLKETTPAPPALRSAMARSAGFIPLSSATACKVLPSIVGSASCRWNCNLPAPPRRSKFSTIASRIRIRVSAESNLASRVRCPPTCAQRGINAPVILVPEASYGYWSAKTSTPEHGHVQSFALSRWRTPRRVVQEL